MIKVGFCVAYDWKLLQYSLPLIYKEADIICLSIDRERISWAGTKFDFDENGFHKLINELDKDCKVRIYEDDFHILSLTPMENEVRQRNCIAKFLGEGGWHIQLDTDEYFNQFSSFTAYLATIKTERPVNIICPFVTLWKKIRQGFLFVSFTSFQEFDKYPVATNRPVYEFGRRNGYFNLTAPWYVLHQSWAREEAEVIQKISNWGHKTDFDTEKYFKFWKEVSIENYQQIRNFHPTDPFNWPALSLFKVNSPDQLIMHADELQLPLPTRWELAKNNSIWLSRLKAIKNKFVKK